MRVLDLISLPLASMWQQKVRTVLTTLGVVFGCFVLTATLSIGQGVQDTIDRIAHRNDTLRQIHVRSDWRRASEIEDIADIKVSGKHSSERKLRLQTAIGQHRPASQKEQVLLDQEKLKQIAALPHVDNAIPIVNLHGFVVFGEHSKSAYISSSRAVDPAGSKRIVAGRYFESADEQSVVVSEYLLYQLGLTNDADIDAAVGRKLRLEFRPGYRETGILLYINKPNGAEATLGEISVLDKIKTRLPELLPKLDLAASELLILKNALQSSVQQPPEPVSREFTIVGIQRAQTADEEKAPWDRLNVNSEVVLPYRTAADLVFQTLAKFDFNLDDAVVIVDREEHAKEVVQKIKDLGLNAYAPLEHIERERLMYLLIFGGMTCVAGVALLVAALGIANTMLMSVLERTREIGIMKSVGAGNGTLQIIFLIEGALIGLLGGSCGLLAAWGASFPGDAYLRGLVSRDLKIDLDESIFVFPPWLAGVVLTFAVLVTTLAAVSPARRAARIDPVKALRHD